MHEDEIKRQLLKAEKRLDAAERLLEAGFYEDAVNRAYYSMYSAVSALFLTRDVRIKTHRGLVTRFGSDFVKSGIIEKEYGRALDIAEDLRCDADYSVARVFTEGESSEMLMVAKSFLNRMKEAIKDAQGE